MHLYHYSPATHKMLIIAVWLEINEAVTKSKDWLDMTTDYLPGKNNVTINHKMPKEWNIYSVIPENKAFYATCKNWLLLREIGYWLTKMNEESFDELHHYILDAKWDDEYENKSSVKDESNLNSEPETLIPPEDVKIDENIQNNDKK